MELFMFTFVDGAIVLLLCVAPMFVELPPGSDTLSELRREY